MTPIRSLRAAAATTMLLVASASPAVAQTPAEDYVAAVAGFEARAAVLVTEVEAVNAAWDSRATSLDDTLAAMQAIESETNALLAELSALVPPEELEGQHAVMLQTVEAMSTSAAEMTSGLRGSDSGEARQAAATSFLAAATDFSDLALLAQGGAAPATTSTTQPAATTTTVAATPTVTTAAALPAATTTAPVAQPAADTDGDGSGAPWVLLPVVMILGIAIGVVAGLMIGRRARVELIEAARNLRSESPTPPD